MNVIRIRITFLFEIEKCGHLVVSCCNATIDTTSIVMTEAIIRVVVVMVVKDIMMRHATRIGQSGW